MKELIKKTIKDENITLNELFNAVPAQKEPWEFLERNLTENKEKQLIILENLKHFNEEFLLSLNELNIKKNNKEINIKETFTEKISLIKDEFEENKTDLKDELFKEQKHLKTELEKIETNYEEQYLSLNKKIKTLKNELSENILVYDSELKENRIEYLKKVNVIYNNKEAEEHRITSRFHEQIQDYHQKNKQRLNQNSLKIQSEDQNLDNYLDFHEKDEIYAKQNYLKTLTNLNEKIHAVTNNYKAIEEKLEKEFKKDNEEIINKLDLKKQEIDSLIDVVLDDYEKEYQDIDKTLDLIREKHHEKEIELKNKYNRKVTSININLHTSKEDINSSLENLDATADKQQIKNLKRDLKNLEKQAEKELKIAEKEYKKDYNKQNEIYVSSYETNLFKRTIHEKIKNNLVLLYKDLYSLEEDYANNLIKLIKLKNNTKKEITKNYLQLEIVPLETQNELANQIYNSELKLQKLENDYMYLKTSRTKQLSNLRSKLHEYNLNKTKDRVQYTYDLELTTSNLTNYLEMELEKNELVYQNKLIGLKKDSLKEQVNKEVLKVKQDFSFELLKEKHQIYYFNYLLQKKIEIKNLNDELLNEAYNYSLNKENILKRQSYYDLEYKEFLTKTENEEKFITSFIKTYNDLKSEISKAEKEIIDTFLTNTLPNSNIEELEVFLTATKELLLINSLIEKELINNLDIYLKDHAKKNIINYFRPNLSVYKNNITDYYNNHANTYFKEREILNIQYKSKNHNLEKLKKEITSSKKQILYAIETIELSKKELETLKKSNSNSSKNLKLIKDLSEHIEINKKFETEKTLELKELKKEFYSLRKAIRILKRSIKRLNLKLIRIEKDKNKALDDAKTLVKNQEDIVNIYLKRIIDLNEDYEKISNTYYNHINLATINSKIINKTKSNILNAYNNKQKFLNQFFYKLHLYKDKALNDLSLVQNKNQQKQTKSFNSLLENLTKNYNKKIKYINDKRKSLEKEHNNELKDLKKTETKEFKLLKEENYINLINKEKEIKKITEAINNYDIDYKNRLEAFIINEQFLLTKEKDKIKKEYKKLVKENLKNLKDVHNNIKRLMNDLEEDDRKHLLHQSYLLRKDKNIRKRILRNQTSEKQTHNKLIDTLSRKVPKINLQIRFIKARKILKERSLLKEIKMKSPDINFFERLSLRYNIRTKTKNSRKDFIKSFKD